MKVLKNLHGIRALLKKRADLYTMKNFRLQRFLLTVGSTLLKLELCKEWLLDLVRMEDMIDRVGNFVPWKARILLILEENELWDEVVHNTTTVPIVVPPSTDATTLTIFNEKDIKARRIILDAVKDHVIPHISSKTRAYQMWDALTNLFQSSNENRKMVLSEKLKSIKDGQREGCDILPY